MDYTLGVGASNQIDAAINRLTNHQDDACKTVGNMARLRYDAPSNTGYGFAAGDPTIAGSNDAYVMMDEFPNGGFYSGWGLNDNHTYVMGSALSATESQLAGLLAHEEYHHAGEDNPGHVTGRSNRIQGVCNGFASLESGAVSQS